MLFPLLFLCLNVEGPLNLGILPSPNRWAGGCLDHDAQIPRVAVLAKKVLMSLCHVFKLKGTSSNAPSFRAAFLNSC
jgi:hypothetical protein